MSEDKLKKKTMRKVEKSFEKFLDETGDDRVVLVKNRSGKVSFTLDEKPFSIRYRSTKYPQGKLVFCFGLGFIFFQEFSTQDSSLEDLVLNVNENIRKGMTIREALGIVIEFYGKPDVRFFVYFFLMFRLR